MTKQDKIAALKIKHPTLQVGSEQAGYTELNADDYEAKIAEWADNELAAEAKLAKAEADKASLLTKLAALGLTTDDLKALGLGTN
jgi:hypothetical protein